MSPTRSSFARDERKGESIALKRRIASIKEGILVIGPGANSKQKEGEITLPILCPDPETKKDVHLLNERIR